MSTLGRLLREETIDDLDIILEHGEAMWKNTQFDLRLALLKACVPLYAFKWWPPSMCSEFTA
jgi:hypothetical protein